MKPTSSMKVKIVWSPCPDGLYQTLFPTFAGPPLLFAGNVHFHLEIGIMEERGGKAPKGILKIPPGGFAFATDMLS
jgi:hypothetical protein